MSAPHPGPGRGQVAAIAGAPLLLVALLIGLFAFTGAGLQLTPPAPIESLAIERIALEPGVITMHLRNTGPEQVTVALAAVNDSIWPATAIPGNQIPRLGTATLVLRYPWVTGEAYALKLITANAVAFEAEVPVAFVTPTPTPDQLLSLALIGLYVGVLPIALGMLWLPAMRFASARVMLFLLGLTAGLLAVLAIETLREALEQGGTLPAPFQGAVLVGIGATLTVLLLSVLGRTERGARDAGRQRLQVAFLIALGIGLHNLGEGLAIGAAYAVGEVALGSFLVIGFILQNVTEGVAIVVPVLRDRVSLRQLAFLALVGGAPAIAGTWIGGLTYAAPLATLFLAVGAGAIVQVLWRVGQLALAEAGRTRAPGMGFAGVAAGMLLLYGIGVLVK